MQRTVLLVLLLLPALLVDGCICETTGVNRGDINLIGHGQEWELGQQLAEEIRQQADIVENDVVETYVGRMGQRIVDVTELADRPWAFHVIEDSSVNAFNIPGGHVFIHTGLIRAAETTAQLAGVVAHEVAHGTARHSTERLTKAYGINVLFSLIAGEQVSLLEQIAAELVGAGTMAKFSRDDEREADRLGLEYMAEAGYDPAGMAAMFESMLRIRQRRPNVVEQFFSTHPLTEERIAEVQNRAAEMETTASEHGAADLNRVQTILGNLQEPGR